MKRLLNAVFILLIFGFFIGSNISLETLAFAQSGSLRVATTSLPTSLDRAITADMQSFIVADQLYDSLVWMDADGNIGPSLAESWTISEDGTEFVFKLRKDVVFHNGEPFTADSVVYTCNRNKQKKYSTSFVFAIAKSVEKIDDFTVKITTENSDASLLGIIAVNWRMVPSKYLAEVGDEGFAAHPIGTGPFQFVKWLKGDRIIFEANPNYWQKGIPKVKEVIFRPIPESSTRVAAMKRGEIDIVTRLNSEEAKSLKGLPDIKVIDYVVDRVFYVAFNNLSSGKGKPTENPLVRQAMNYAVDVKSIIDALFDGYGRESTGLVTPANLGFDKNIKPFGYNPEKAKELLAEAGYPNGFKMDFAYPSYVFSNFDQVCESIQGYLGDVGIETDLKPIEPGQFWELQGKRQLPPIYGDSWSESSNEAFFRLHGFLGGEGSPYCQWSDPKIVSLLGEIFKTLDKNKRAGVWVELQRYMQKNPPVIYLYEPVTFEAMSSRVKNYKPAVSEAFYLKEVSLTSE